MKLSRVMNRLGKWCFALVFISMAVNGILAFGVYRLNGEYAWSELPVPVGYSLGATLFFAIATGALMLGTALVRGMANASVVVKGQPAMARIIRVEGTGETINDDPVVRILVDVCPSYQPSFRSEAEQIISRFEMASLQPGALVPVKYDPASHAVAITAEGPSAPCVSKPAVGGSDWSEQDRLLVEQQGTDGLATLLAVEEAGPSQNSHVVVRITYEVCVPYRTPYKVTKDIPLSARYAQQLKKGVGRSFPARIHPYDPQKVGIDVAF